MKERTTITVSDETCGELHEALDCRIRHLIDALQGSDGYPESTTRMLRETLVDVQAAMDEFSNAWGDAEDKKREAAAAAPCVSGVSGGEP